MQPILLVAENQKPFNAFNEALKVIGKAKDKAGNQISVQLSGFDSFESNAIFGILLLATDRAYALPLLEKGEVPSSIRRNVIDPKTLNFKSYVENQLVFETTGSVENNNYTLHFYGKNNEAIPAYTVERLINTMKNFLLDAPQVGEVKGETDYVALQYTPKTWRNAHKLWDFIKKAHNFIYDNDIAQDSKADNILLIRKPLYDYVMKNYSGPELQNN